MSDEVKDLSERLDEIAIVVYGPTGQAEKGHIVRMDRVERSMKHQEQTSKNMLRLGWIIVGAVVLDWIQKLTTI